jgi:hypothetical protein
VLRIERYDLREENGIRWWRLRFAPFDYLIDPGVWIKDTSVERQRPGERGVMIGRFLVRPLRPQFYFDHGTRPGRRGR